MNNITHGLEQEHLKGNLLRHVETFAQEVQKDKYDESIKELKAKGLMR